MAYRSDWVAQIQRDAPRYGLDPRAVLAIASHEGLSGGVGDGGHAFGPFQLNDAGGVLTNRPGNHQAFAQSPQGIDWALQQMAQDGARGLSGLAAIRAIATKFERPANPQAEIQDAANHYGGIGAQQGASPGGASMQPIPSMAGTGNAGGLFRQMLAQQMGQNALQTVQSGTPVTTSLAGMAALRQRLGAAQSVFGAGSTGGLHAPGVHSGHYPGQTLSGGHPMVIGGKSPYTNIRPSPQVDWQHVNPRLLRAINDVAKSHGVIVDLTSGYRSNEHSQAVGGFAGDPHTKGIAVDATVNGQPIGNVIGPDVWGHYGVRSGAVPNFQNGHPDPVHLDLMA